MGSQLVEIRSATENKFVVNIGLGTFTDKPSQHLEHVNRWIGLSDSKKEGTWVWQGSNAVAAYTNWARNEPNNYGPGGWGANCALIWKNHDGEWDDQNCDRKNHFVCQKSEDRLMLGSSFVQCAFLFFFFFALFHTWPDAPEGTCACHFPSELAENRITTYLAMLPNQATEAQWPIGCGVGLRIKRSSV